MPESSHSKIRLSESLTGDDADLDRELPSRVLRPSNPRAAINTAQYFHKDRVFKVDENVKSLIMHFSKSSTLLRGQSPCENESKRAQKSNDHTAFDNPVPDPDVSANILRNQFFFNDRSAQTNNPIIREMGASTMPAPSCDYNDSVNLHAIHDKFMEMIESTKAPADDTPRDEGDIRHDPPKQDPVYSERMKSSVKVMERLLHVNLENDVFQDYKYYVDKSDSFKTSGSLLPLWRFTNDKTKRKQVTSLEWNPVYHDMFAVSFGSFEFLKQQAGGAVAIYSLKNPKFPELLIQTDFTVCCVAWNKAKPALLAVGMYDGTVGIMDVRSRNKKFIYQSTVRESKHTDPVWEIRWDEVDMSFTSISVDGRVCNWKLKKSKLDCETITELRMTGQACDDEPSAAVLTGLGNGLSFDLSPHDPDMYLVGTEEGMILKCSRFLSSNAVMTYPGHSMAVYAVRWNRFNPDLFASASADWTVKLWRSEAPSGPLCSFDLGQAVGDIDWSPVSGSVLAAVNSEGSIFVLDLDTNRYKEVTHQKVIPKGKLTRVAFNRHEPILVVGDDRGSVSCLKLSPNLRKGEGDPATEKAKVGKIIDALS